ncbi:MAG: hypothetical protein H6Q73_1630 [Firmicutes bacterium]|nr:hypothetical protein [Bacillota bacterium]
MIILKKPLLVVILLLIILIAMLFSGCRGVSQIIRAGFSSDTANISKADISQTVFANFKEEGFATLDEAEKAAIEMYVKKDYKAMVDHSTAESMIEGALLYDGVTDFNAYFIQKLKSSFGDGGGKLVYCDPKLVQAWKARDGMSAHYLYNFTNDKGKGFGVGFAIVNKNGKFLLDYGMEKYIFEEVFYKFNSNKDILAMLTQDAQNPCNVILPIALAKCVDQEVARPWKIWFAIASQQHMELKKMNFVTDNGRFNVDTKCKMGPEGAYVCVEAPMKFGKVTQVTATDKNGQTYEFKIIGCNL